MPESTDPQFRCMESRIFMEPTCIIRPNMYVESGSYSSAATVGWGISTRSVQRQSFPMTVFDLQLALLTQSRRASLCELEVDPFSALE